MKKLYEVEIKVYVMAEDKEDALYIASRECQPEEAEAYEAESVDALWWKSIPYGSDDDKTCGEIIGEMIAAAKAESIRQAQAAAQYKMFGN